LKTLEPAGDLAKLFRDAGVLPSQEVIVYGQVCVRASQEIFVLRLIRYDRLRNYYGAWEEWGNHHDLPIATRAPEK